MRPHGTRRTDRFVQHGNALAGHFRKQYSPVADRRLSPVFRRERIRPKHDIHAVSRDEKCPEVRTRLKHGGVVVDIRLQPQDIASERRQKRYLPTTALAAVRDEFLPVHIQHGLRRSASDNGAAAFFRLGHVCVGNADGTGKALGVFEALDRKDVRGLVRSVHNVRSSFLRLEEVCRAFVPKSRMAH